MVWTHYRDFAVDFHENYDERKLESTAPRVLSYQKDVGITSGQRITLLPDHLAVSPPTNQPRDSRTVLSRRLAVTCRRADVTYTVSGHWTPL